MFDTTPTNYEVQNIAEIEDFDKDQYGNTWYNVKFQGGADTYMWLAKNEPEEGKTYYGHFEPTKSGKRFRFKTDKLPEGFQKTSDKLASGTQNAYLKDVSDMRYRVWHDIKDQWDVRTLHKDPSESADFWDAVDYHTDELLNGIEKIRSGAQGAHPTKELKEDSLPAAAIHDKLNRGFTKPVATNEDEFGDEEQH